jgi:hypothetical protein
MRSAVRRPVGPRPAWRALGTAVVAATLVGAVACGQAGGSASPSTKSPSTELRSAVSGLGDAHVLTGTVQLHASAQTLRDLAKASGEKLPSGIPTLITGSKAVTEIAAPDGKKISELAAHPASTGKFRFALTTDGGKIVQVRAVAKRLYLRADVDKIAKLAGADLNRLRSRVPDGYGWAQAALHGRWVSLDLAALQGQAGGALKTPSPQASAHSLRGLRQALVKDVTVRRTGRAGGADHLVLSGNVRTIGHDLLGALRRMSPQAGNLPIHTGNLPNKKAHVDAYVADGTLKALSLDLAQFAGGRDDAALHGRHLPLRVDFARSGGDITKPSGATAVDPRQLMALFSELMQSSDPMAVPGATGAASATSVPASGHSRAVAGRFAG